jgi:hypothetical protein
MIRREILEFTLKELAELLRLARGADRNQISLGLILEGVVSATLMFIDDSGVGPHQDQ